MPRTDSPLFLPEDIIDDVLTFMPDFDCLRSFVLTSNAMHNVFRTRRHSILSSVAENVMGCSAWPMALRLVKCREARDDILKLPSEDDVFKQGPTSRDLRHAMQYTDDARSLENLFSSRHKDRSSWKSQLESIEATRFHRALYRIWLYTGLFGLCHISQQEYGDQRSDTEKDQGCTAQIIFLDAFPTQELIEMDQVAAFLVESVLLSEVYSTLARQDKVRATKVALTAMPEEFLLLHDLRSPLLQCHNANMVGDDEVITSRIRQILAQRKSVISADAFTYKGTILTDVDGPYGKCEKCDHRKHIELWNETNWHFLCTRRIGHISFFYRAQYSLSRWPRFQFDRVVDNDAPWSELMHFMFDNRLSALAQWTKQDMLCRQCLLKFMEVHTLVWQQEWDRHLPYT